MVKTILCLGDSLTHGINKPKSYPGYLRTVLKGWGSYNIINSGVNGDTSLGVLGRVEWLLRQHKPYLVITCIGTNDMLLGKAPDYIKSNIISICHKVTQSGAKNLILGVPNWYNGTPITEPVDHPLYAEVGRELGVYVQTGGLAFHESNSIFRSFDNVHLNEWGYNSWSYYVGQAMNYGGLM